MKIYYIVNARIPNKKAYGIQVAKMSEGFVESGAEVVLLVPRTDTFLHNLSLKQFYQLRQDVPVITLPVIDWYSSGRLGYWITSLLFACSAAWHLYRAWSRDKGVGAYILDTDGLSYFLYAFLPVPYWVETDRTPLLAYLGNWGLRRARGIFAINSEVKKDIVESLKIPECRIHVSHNAVDDKQFVMREKIDSRRALGIPDTGAVALFAGRFWGYKGVSIFSAAAELITSAHIMLLGGSKEEYMQAADITSIPPRLHVVGECASYEVPLWLTAADVLIVTGTASNVKSARYFSPMKVYEYMASLRPIIAADLPAIRAVLPDDCATWYVADSAEDLAHKIDKVISNNVDHSTAIKKAFDIARKNTWLARAKRTITLMEATHSFKTQ